MSGVVADIEAALADAEGRAERLAASVAAHPSALTSLLLGATRDEARTLRRILALARTDADEI